MKTIARSILIPTLASLAGYLARTEPMWLKVERVRIPIKHLLPGLEGLKIVHMSDFHLDPFNQIDLIHQAVAIANSLHPDLTVLTGDFVTRRAEAIWELSPVLAQLTARYGVFAVFGNHDVWTNAQMVRTGLQEAGIVVLRNTGVVLGNQHAPFYLAGLDDGCWGFPHMDQALADVPQGILCILLMHEPDFADAAAQDERVALQLSGHTHGGQIRLPFIGTPVLPYMGRCYVQGLYRVNGMWLYVTRGIGSSGLPLRLNCRPEVTEIRLVSDSSGE